MQRTLIATLLAVVLLFAGQGVSVAAAGTAGNSHVEPSSIIPEHAVQVAQNVFSLGKAFNQERGDFVEGYLIVHPKKGYDKPDGTPGKGKEDKGGGGTKCYEFLARDAKWRGVEDWIVNPANPDGISDASILAILEGGIAKWEDAADGEVGDGLGVDILGDGTLTATPLEADTESMDDQNEVYFDLLDEGTIGVTIIWGVFGGPPSGRELLEWDQIYNTFYDWSDNGDPLAMDFDNIATHELGHSVGMGDLYSGSCSAETMYGFSTEGETSKQDLNTGDIAGISKLY